MSVPESRGEDAVAEGNPVVDKMPTFTLESLGTCNGVASERLCVGIQGLVYEVGAHEAGRMFYGPGGSYCIFAGHDATMSLAKMSLDTSLLNKPPSVWASLSAEERHCLSDWASRFSSKYRLVGTVDFGSEGNAFAASWRRGDAQTDDAPAP